MAESGGLHDTAVGWRHYMAYLGVLAEEEPKRRGEKFGRLSRGWMVGSETFKEELKQRLGPGNVLAERFELLGGGPESRRVLRAETWEAKLRTEARVLGIALDALPKQKSALEKVRLAVQLKNTTDVSNGWLAARLDMGEAASVSQYVRRHHLRAGTPPTREDAAKYRQRAPGKRPKTFQA